ncbi:MAG: hypothetical protein ACOC2F_04305 [Bacteroidota bacterium]
MATATCHLSSKKLSFTTKTHPRATLREYPPPKRRPTDRTRQKGPPGLRSVNSNAEEITWEPAPCPEENVIDALYTNKYQGRGL